MLDFFNDNFFTDQPLPHPIDGWRAEWQARSERMTRWAAYVIVEINGHCAGKRSEDLGLGDSRVFYDGDYSDLLAPDDPRNHIPRDECSDLPSLPVHLEWDDWLALADSDFRHRRRSRQFWRGLCKLFLQWRIPLSTTSRECSRGFARS